MARRGKKPDRPHPDTPADVAGDAPVNAQREGRKPPAQRTRGRTPPPADPIVVAQGAGQVVVAGKPGPAPDTTPHRGDDVWERLKALLADLETAGREWTRHREESQTATRRLLQESGDATDRLRRECEATATQLAEARRQLQDAGRSLLTEFESQLALVRQELPATRRTADEGHRLDAAGRRESDRNGDAARQRLESLRQETAQEEARLAAVRGEVREAEGRLRELRRQLERPLGKGPGTTAGRPPKVRGRFGVTVDPGVVVADVSPGTPAETAGLAPGDVVTAVNGDPVFSVTELRDRIDDSPLGQEVVLRVNRGGVVREVTTRIEPETSEQRPRLGLTVRPGVVITETRPGTPAASAGLAPGDVIAEVNGTPVMTGKQFRDAVHGWSGGEFVLRVCRGGATYEIARAG